MKENFNSEKDILKLLKIKMSQGEDLNIVHHSKDGIFYLGEMNET